MIIIEIYVLLSIALSMFIVVVLVDFHHHGSSILYITMHDSWESGVTITLRLSLLKSRRCDSDRHGGRLLTLGAALAPVTTMLATPGPSGEEGGSQAQEASHHQHQVQDNGGHPGHVHQRACRQYRVIKLNSVAV